MGSAVCSLLESESVFIYMKTTFNKFHSTNRFAERTSLCVTFAMKLGVFAALF